MKYILFANPQYGVDFMLMRQLKLGDITYDYVSILDKVNNHSELYKKYNIRTTPVLISLDEEEQVIGRLSSIDEIVEFFKKSNENV